MENIFNQVIAEYFPHLEVQEAFRTQNRLRPERNSLHHIIGKKLIMQTRKEYRKLQERSTKSTTRQTHQNNSRFHRRKFKNMK
jgi:hypothetical protein